MAATTYKKYYKITCDSFSSRFHNVLRIHTLSHRGGQSFFFFFLLFSRECPITHIQIHIWLRENRLCPVLASSILASARFLISPSFAFLKYIIIECAFATRPTRVLSCRDRSACRIGRTHPGGVRCALKFAYVCMFRDHCSDKEGEEGCSTKARTDP